jgi:SAM-dependent methyltransferase
MREFERYGTVDFAVCCLDGINHLTSPKDISKCFDLVHNYLIPDGIFIFDVNGKYKFENIYADNTYAMEEEGGMCVWENYYDPDSKICDFYITLFKECQDGRYERYDDEQRERMYTISEMRKMLCNSGFEFIGAYSDFEFHAADDSTDRIYIVAKCKK